MDKRIQVVYVGEFVAVEFPLALAGNHAVEYLGSRGQVLRFRCGLRLGQLLINIIAQRRRTARLTGICLFFILGQSHGKRHETVFALYLRNRHLHSKHR